MINKQRKWTRWLRPLVTRTLWLLFKRNIQVWSASDGCAETQKVGTLYKMSIIPECDDLWNIFTPCFSERQHPKTNLTFTILWHRGRSGPFQAEIDFSVIFRCWFLLSSWAKWLFNSISRLLIMFLESNSKLWFHFNHFVVFCFCSCVQITRFDTVTETYFCAVFLLYFSSFFLPSYFRKRWGSTFWGLQLLACCIIVNKMSAFFFVEINQEGNTSRCGYWNSLTVWTRFFFYLWAL